MKILTEIETPKSLRVILFLILALSFVFRIIGIDWDQKHHLHPDERMLVMVTQQISFPSDVSQLFTQQSPLNPKFFAYGSLPIYLLKAVSVFTGFLVGQKWTGYDYLPYIGRLLVVLFDLGIIIIGFKLIKKVFSKQIALFWMVFYATAVFPIQVSHFFTVDTFMAFFIILCLYLIVDHFENPTVKKAFMIGFAFAGAAASKVSSLVVLVSLGICLGVETVLLGIQYFLIYKNKVVEKLKQRMFLVFKKNRYSLHWDKAKKMLLSVGIVLVSFAVFFFIFEPYAYLDWDEYSSQLSYQMRMAKDPYVFPYTLQYVGTPAYLYFLKDVILWGIGLPLGLWIIPGMVYYALDLVCRVFKKGDYQKEAKELILFSFLISYFLLIGRSSVKFMRYFLPLYPFFILYAVMFLFRLKKLFTRTKFKIFLSVILLFHLTWMLFFMNIYLQKNTRINATQWIKENISKGSLLAVEHWDDPLPLTEGYNYKFLELPMYEPDSSRGKWRTVNDVLNQADYIILSSNRLYKPLQKLDDCEKYLRCYPLTSQYYKDLFNGKIGFELIKEFRVCPGLDWIGIGFRVCDDQADESFSVYDHPRVLIFKRSNMAEQEQN